MEALAALIAYRCYDQYTVSCAETDGIGEQRVGFGRGGRFTATDIDDMGSSLHSLYNSAGKVNLRTGSKLPSGLIPKYGHDKAATAGRNPVHWPPMLPKDHAGDVRSVLGGRPWSGNP